ncbi:hypothetical protein F5883DRAFT_690818 [Diaporthe sp. PMI_573]|nr:hypothetical protein F5883DRAFT_666955 [Diaporthaceae sp. PMI_573]KAH8753350.1 hypothetical protein F5883DRAFT_690818 [Diaporthaceae sp. PMI_573]
MFQLKALLLAGHPSRSQVSCYESASLFFLDLKANIFPRLLLSVTAHRSRWLLDTTIDFLRRQARRLLPSLPEARVSAAAPRTSQAERGLIFIPSLSILEVLLGQTRVYLEILVVAGLRVKGLGGRGAGPVAAGRSLRLDNGPRPRWRARGGGRLVCSGHPPLNSLAIRKKGSHAQHRRMAIAIPAIKVKGPMEIILLSWAFLVLESGLSFASLLCICCCQSPRVSNEI